MKHRAIWYRSHSSRGHGRYPANAPGARNFKPSKQIEAVVHTGPGGGSDILARAIAEMLQKEKLIPQRMQVVNKSGGGPAVAMSYLAEKKGETHTIGFFTGVWVTNPLTTPEANVTVKGLDADRPAGFGAGGDRGQSGLAVQRHEGLYRGGEEKS